jgi:hypothetical protein
MQGRTKQQVVRHGSTTARARGGGAWPAHHGIVSKHRRRDAYSPPRVPQSAQEGLRTTGRTDGRAGGWPLVALPRPGPLDQVVAHRLCAHHQAEQRSKRGLSSQLEHGRGALAARSTHTTNTAPTHTVRVEPPPHLPPPPCARLVGAGGGPSPAAGCHRCWCWCCRPQRVWRGGRSRHRRRRRRHAH